MEELCYPLEFESNQIVTVSYPKQCLPLFLWSIYITHHLQSIQLKERDDYFLIVLHRLMPKEEILTTSNVKRTILLIHWKIRQIHLATCFDCQPKCKNTIRFLSIIIMLQGSFTFIITSNQTRKYFQKLDGVY